MSQRIRLALRELAELNGRNMDLNWIYTRRSTLMYVNCPVMRKRESGSERGEEGRVTLN